LQRCNQCQRFIRICHSAVVCMLAGPYGI
jgi:hypothetical protein